MKSAFAHQFLRTLVETCPDKWCSWPKVMRQEFTFEGSKILGEATEGELANLDRGCWARVMRLAFICRLIEPGPCHRMR